MWTLVPWITTRCYWTSEDAWDFVLPCINENTGVVLNYTIWMKATYQINFTRWKMHAWHALMNAARLDHGTAHCMVIRPPYTETEVAELSTDVEGGGGMDGQLADRVLKTLQTGWPCNTLVRFIPSLIHAPIRIHPAMHSCYHASIRSFSDYRRPLILSVQFTKRHDTKLH